MSQVGTIIYNLQQIVACNYLAFYIILYFVIEIIKKKAIILFDTQLFFSYSHCGYNLISTNNFNYQIICLF